LDPRPRFFWALYLILDPASCQGKGRKGRREKGEGRREKGEGRREKEERVPLWALGFDVVPASRFSLSDSQIGFP